MKSQVFSLLAWLGRIVERKELVFCADISVI